MENQENKEKKQNEKTETTTSVTIEVKMHEKRQRSERREVISGEDHNYEMVPVTNDDHDFTFNVEISSEKVKSILKIIGEGVGDFVKEKIGGSED